MLLFSSGFFARRFFHSIRWMKYSPSNSSVSALRVPPASSSA